MRVRNDVRCPGCGMENCPRPSLECDREPISVVPVSLVEHVVGQQRWHFQHIGMYDGRTVTILHSHRCRDSTPDLRDCVFSHALANGTTPTGCWVKDYPHLLEVKDGLLHPGLELPRTYIPTTRQCSE